MAAPVLVGSPLALKWATRDLGNLEAVLRLVPGRTAVIQAGGELGLFPARLAREFATVYMFEPAADLFACCQRNAPAANIVRLQAALGDRHDLVGTVRARRDTTGKPVHEGLTFVVPGAGTVPMLRIDDLALPVCDLIYLDIEGLELAALKGGVETLARCRPVVTIEINKCLTFVGLQPEDVRGFLVAQGYRHVQTLQNDEVFVPQERPC